MVGVLPGRCFIVIGDRMTNPKRSSLELRERLENLRSQWKLPPSPAPPRSPLKDKDHDIVAGTTLEPDVVEHHYPVWDLKPATPPIRHLWIANWIVLLAVLGFSFLAFKMVRMNEDLVQLSDRQERKIKTLETEVEELRTVAESLILALQQESPQKTD